MNLHTNDTGNDHVVLARRRVVIFDFDGTLADSIGWFFSVVNDVAQRYDFRQMTAEQREELRRKPPLEILNALGIPKWKLPAIAMHMRALAAQNIDQIKLFGWVGDLLLELKSNGVMIAVVSSNSAANIQQILGPYAPLVDHYETGASLFGKSMKFRRALKALNAEPEDAVSVGDEVRDIDAAHRAGVVSIGVAWGASHDEALIAARATKLAATSNELWELLLPP